MKEAEQYKCKSYADDKGEVQDCTCGKCGYQQNVSKWKKAYSELLAVCKKYPEFKNKYSYEFGDIHDMQKKAENHLLLIKWYEEYGLKLDHTLEPVSSSYCKINDHVSFQYFNDAEKEKNSGNGGRYISWPDDDKQPKNEWILCISFSTGPYIFGSSGFGEDNDYPKEFFMRFFDELASYKPDYSDRHNSGLYWKLENAKDIFDNFNTIKNKYHELNKIDFKKREIERKKKELEKLEASV